MNKNNHRWQGILDIVLTVLYPLASISNAYSAIVAVKNEDYLWAAAAAVLSFWMAAQTLKYLQKG